MKKNVFIIIIVLFLIGTITAYGASNDWQLLKILPNLLSTGSQVDSNSQKDSDLITRNDPSEFLSPVETTEPEQNNQKSNTPSTVQVIKEYITTTALKAGKAINIVNNTIENTGVTSLQEKSGDLVLSSGSGIDINGLEIENSDKGSSQDIFKKIAVSGQNTIEANSNDSTLTFAGGTGITLTTDKDNRKLTITNTSTSTNSFSDLSATGSVTFSGLNSGVVFSSSGVLNSEAQLSVGRGGTGIPTFTVGDLMYSSGSTTLSKLGIGSSGLALVSNGTSPTWGTLGASGITNDSLDFAQLDDLLELDATTTISNGGNNFNITGTGNIGIGTTDPIHKFSIYGLSSGYNTPLFSVTKDGTGTDIGPTITALFKNTTDIVGGSDYQNEVHLRLQAGTTTDHRRYLNFAGYDGVDDWLTGANANNTWILYDANTPVHRFWFENTSTGTGVTYINSAGTGAVIINGLNDGTNNAGTDGLIIRSGGSSPLTLYDFDGSGTLSIGEAVTATKYMTYITGTKSENTGSSQGGMYLNPVYSPTANSTSSFVGINANPRTSGSFNSNSLSGMSTIATHLASAPLTSLIGGSFVGQNLVGQTVTNAYGGQFQVQNTHASGVITNGYGIQVTSPSNSGTLSNYYGIRILDATAGSFTTGMRSGISSGSNKYNLYIDGTAQNYINGNVGIGTTTPSTQLHTTGGVRFATFGAGSLQTDANGNLSVSSDERLKVVKGNFGSALEKIKQLNGVTYRWNELSGMDTEHDYVGFLAQDVEDLFPNLVGTNPNGYKSLNYAGLTVPIVEAIKEQQLQIDILDDKVSAKAEVSITNYLDDKSLDTTLTWKEAIVTFLKETIFTAKVTFREKVEMLSQVVFRGDLVIFESPVAFNQDTISEVIMPKKARRMHISFKAPFNTTPIVSLTPQKSLSVTYAIENINKDGFEIVLSDSLEEDIKFTWFAAISENTESPRTTIIESDDQNQEEIDSNLNEPTVVTPTPEPSTTSNGSQSTVDPISEEVATNSAQSSN